MRLRLTLRVRSVRSSLSLRERAGEARGEAEKT